MSFPINHADAEKYFKRHPTDSELDAVVTKVTNNAIKDAACRISEWPVKVQFVNIMKGNDLFRDDCIGGINVYERVIRLYSPTYDVVHLIKTDRDFHSIAEFFDYYNDSPEYAYSRLSFVFSPKGQGHVA